MRLGAMQRNEFPVTMRAQKLQPNSPDTLRRTGAYQFYVLVITARQSYVPASTNIARQHRGSNWPRFHCTAGGALMKALLTRRNSRPDPKTRTRWAGIELRYFDNSGRAKVIRRALDLSRDPDLMAPRGRQASSPRENWKKRLSFYLM
jgi:hypothetical protein